MNYFNNEDQPTQHFWFRYISTNKYKKEYPIQNRKNDGDDKTNMNIYRYYDTVNQSCFIVCSLFVFNIYMKGNTKYIRLIAKERQRIRICMSNKKGKGENVDDFYINYIYLF